jgi:EmrB/QacA subfamily drug resistance transporter
MRPTVEQVIAHQSHHDKWRVLVTVMIGTIAAILSSTIVNVAIPDLSRYFHLGQESVQWVSTGFMLSMTLSMLSTPWLLKRFGLRRTYAGTIALLMVGGIVGGLSVNYPMLLAMRVAEGLAAGIMQPIPAIVIMRAFDKHEQGRAMGVFGFGVVLAPAMGPSVGGFLVEHFGWRSIFFVVVPFCLIAQLLIRRLQASPAPSTDQPLDWKGLLLAGVCVVCLLNGFTHMRDDVPLAVVLLVLGILGFIGFIAYQLKAQAPLMHMKLFRYRQFSMGALVAFVYGAGLFGSTYLLPVYMQMALEYTPSHSGLVLLPAGIALAITIPLAGRLADRFPPYVMVSIGLSLLTTSFLLMAMGSIATGFFALTALAILGRIGLGCTMPSLNLGAMRGVETSLIAQGSSTINFLRQLGGSIGVSLAGIVLEWRLAANRSGLEAGVAGAKRIAAFNQTFLFVAALCAIAVAAAWHMREGKIQTDKAD